MSQDLPPVPPSPSEDDYVSQVTSAAPQPLLPEHDPLELFGEWFAQARTKEPNDPNAMALATTNVDGDPDLRMVLLKGYDEAGFTFFTNLQSAKGQGLTAHPAASLLFHWKSLRRQVRIRGPVFAVSDFEADVYFATRARPSQIGAWASDQSRVMSDRFALEKRVAEVGLKFGLGKVSRPAHWSGFRLVPRQIEFWRDRPFRLHERLVFERTLSPPETGSGQGPWSTSRLFP
jgi:pyridoxamine 5'-phosphate oxidase